MQQNARCLDVIHLFESGLDHTTPCGYDNACKLLAYARKHKEARLPLTQEYIQQVSMFLDRFHKDNHTWCLTHMPEVNPENADIANLIQNRNTEACEQLNSWISHHTLSSLEMAPGAFGIYWWSISP